MEDASQGHNDTVVLLNTVQQSLTTRLSRVVFFFFFFRVPKKICTVIFTFIVNPQKDFFSFPFDIFTKSMHRGLRFHSLVVRKRVIPRTKLRCVCMCVCVGGGVCLGITLRNIHARTGEGQWKAHVTREQEKTKNMHKCLSEHVKETAFLISHC